MDPEISNESLVEYPLGTNIAELRALDKRVKVHKTLAYSYSLYLVALIVGVTLDYLNPIHLFAQPVMIYTGFAILIFATLLIVWAQATNRNLDMDPLRVETFLEGPYKITRIPTHFGLFFAMIGFGIVSNSVFVVFMAVIAFIVTKETFVKKQEEILALKYGEPYLEYKYIVKI